MKLNFNFNFKGLDGKQLLEQGKPINAGKMLSQVISNLNSGNSVKLWDWALKLYNDKPIEVDNTDAEVLLELINKADVLTVLAKAQLITLINDAKEKEKK